MKNFLLIICVLISADLFAQDKNDYLITNNGDTVYCKIKKFDIYGVKNQSRDSLNRRVVSKSDTSDLEAIVANGYAFELTRIKENELSYSHAFLPENNSLQNVRVHNSQFDLSKYNDADITVYQIILKANGITPYMMGGLIPAAIDAADKKRSYAQFLILIKNNQDNEIIDLSDRHWNTKGNMDAWILLKSYLKNNSECAAQLDKYINDNTRVNDGRILKLLKIYFNNIKLTNLDI